MNPGATEIVVQHEPAERRFSASVDGHLCVADYEMRNGEMVMTHTYVPAELRGRGIAQKLVQSALEYARANQHRVIPACSYVDVFIRRHPEYQVLVD